MFTFFIKPKQAKPYRGAERYVDSTTLYSLFFTVELLLFLAWIISIPFLFMSFALTIAPFTWITVVGVIVSLIAKLMHPDSEYFRRPNPNITLKKDNYPVVRAGSTTETKENRLEVAYEEGGKRLELALVRKRTKERR